MIWNREAECMPVKERKRLQLERLKDVIGRAYAQVPYYRRRFDEMKIKPADIRSLEDIQRLPFTTKTDQPRACFESFRIGPTPFCWDGLLRSSASPS